MQKATADDRGTVQYLAQELENVHENGEAARFVRNSIPGLMRCSDGIQFQLSTRSAVQEMPPELYSTVLRHFKLRLPDLNIRSWLAPAQNGVDGLPLHPSAVFFEHAIVRQVKYVAGRHLKNAADSIVCVQIPGLSVWVGELLDIFAITQPGLGTHRFGRVRWMRPLALDVSNTIWESA